MSVAPWAAPPALPAAAAHKGSGAGSANLMPVAAPILARPKTGAGLPALAPMLLRVSMQNEQQRLRARCRHPSGGYVEFRLEETGQSVASRFEQQAERHPDRLALLTRRERRTYRELNRGADRVARAVLATLGPGEEPVALLFEPGPAAIEAILGVLKAGKIYMPLDPSSPRPRLSFMLEDSGARLGLTDDPNASLAREPPLGTFQWLGPDELSARTTDEGPALALSPERLASLYYTSGSTGRPKGVVETHRNRLVNAMRNTNALRICREDRLSLLYHHAFSGSVNCLFGALLNGAALLPIDLKEEGIGRLAGWMADEAMTLYHSPPPVFRHLVASLSGAERFPHLRVILLASDSLYATDVELYRQHFSPDCLLLNAWGATESPFFRPYFLDQRTAVPTGNVPAIGPPDGEDEILLLNEAGRELGVNEVGEIVMRSRFLSPGYWRNPELTEARFHPDPESEGHRCYRTGDLGRRLEDGSVVHLGRQDFQVKVRGYRIELSEIEIALLHLDRVREAVVVGRPMHAGDHRLVAYIVPDRHAAPTISELRRALAGTLPDYMIPSAFVVLDDLPRTPNGKVDRGQLPEPGRARPPLEPLFLTPRTETEKALAAIWSEVLDLESVGVEDHFLDLGGNSLLATQVIARVLARLRVSLPIRALFEAPTIARMAELIESRRADEPADSAVEQLLAELEVISDEQARRFLSRDIV
jgi:amino acid adenylation domain-containing protein